MRVHLPLLMATLLALPIGAQENPRTVGVSGEKEARSADLIVGPGVAEVPESAAAVPEAEEEQADAVGRVILAAVPELGERKTAEDAVDRLIGLKDVRVKRLFERLVASEVYERGDEAGIVWAPVIADAEDGSGMQASLYPLLAEGEAAASEGETALPAAPPSAVVPFDELKRFRVFRPALNRIRDSLALIGLELDDPAERERAAIDTGNKRQSEAVPLLVELAEEDPDAGVRRAAAESLALIRASGGDPAATPGQVVAAVEQIGTLKSIRGLDLLDRLAADEEATPAVRSAAAAAAAQVQRHITATNWIKNAFFGLSLGSILVLMALGLAITFGLMGVINMAHGEMLMIGAVGTWATFTCLSGGQLFSWLPGLDTGLSAGWLYAVALPVSFLVAAAAGWLVEATIVRFLYKRPLDSLLATIGVSFVLIQLVRNWKGDNLPLVRPAWAGGSIELMQDVSFSTARLFIIALSIACVVAVAAIFRFTKAGLLVRATSQNRDMARALGVNTRRVDALTFAFGSGLAGIAGYGLYLIASVSPQMGQGYIVDSFLVVVVGGVGQLAGVVLSGFGIGFAQKMLEPLELITEPIRLFDATWANVAVLAGVVLFIQRRPGGLFPERGRQANLATGDEAPWASRPSGWTDALMMSLLVGLGLVLVPILYGSGTLSIDDVNRYGYFATYAICAVGLDLLWGYVGVLSLCQFLFFAFGAYAAGFYLINHGPKINGIPECLYYVMSGTGDLTAPAYLSLFENGFVSLLLALLIPGAVAFALGVVMFRSRVKGVYFAILTQTFTVIALRVFQKNELGMGGTNGIRITFTETLFGHPIMTTEGLGPFEQTRFRLYAISVVALILSVVVAKLITRSRYGRVLLAIRDDETRLRFGGYRTWLFKAGVFAVAGVMAGLGGALYLPQKGIITPGDMAPYWSILVVAWVAVGGRGTVWGAVIGAIGVSAMYAWMTSNHPAYWMFALGALFILTPLLLPGGVMSLPAMLGGRLRKAGGA
ncbi:urea ABC transporter permease subunit UrtB [Phycisphaera mikurensis]|nr:urea ABC transporter permease subunit UrtB [Phycisphaera mikurensis]MBB6441197.1 urea transport system permease protein [Phycisphaera mikurensis]